MSNNPSDNPKYEELAAYLDSVVERALDDEVPDRERRPRPPVEGAPPPRPSLRGRTRTLLRRVYTPVAREEILLVQQVDARLKTEWARIDTALASLELAVDDLRARVDAVVPGAATSPPASADVDRVTATVLRGRRAPAGLADLAGEVATVAADGPVLVLGCEDDDWPTLLVNRGAAVTAVDANAELVASCRSRGIDAVDHPPLDLLESMPLQSLRAVTALSIVDTLDLHGILALCEHALRALVPGGLLVLGAVSPADPATALATLARDPRPRRLLHPDVLVTAAEASGFATEVRDLDRAGPGDGEPTTYAVVARRPLRD